MSDLYLSLGSIWNPESVYLLDNYTSIIWKDRFCGYGDFELTIPETSLMLADIKYYRWLRSSFSSSIMLVETVKSSEQAPDGTNLFTVTGRSFEHLFLYKNNFLSHGRETEVFNGGRSSIVNTIVNRYCINPATAGPVNVIPGLVTSASLDVPTVRLEVPRGYIYDLIQEVLMPADIGFKVFDYPQKGEGLLFFTYQGIDRTDPSDNILYQEYSVDAGSLHKIDAIESISNYRNHVRIFGTKTAIDYYPPGISSDISGIERRTLVIKDTNIGTDVDYVPQEDDPPPTTIQEDQEALRKHAQAQLLLDENRYIRVIEGEMIQKDWDSTYYGLGDLVILEDEFGRRQKSIITETIHTIDINGVIQMPTFEPRPDL